MPTAACSKVSLKHSSLSRVMFPQGHVPLALDTLHSQVPQKKGKTRHNPGTGSDLSSAVFRTVCQPLQERRRMCWDESPSRNYPATNGRKVRWQPGERGAYSPVR